MASCMTKDSSHFLANAAKKKIVIIGAGISGLACACRLKELGFQNVLILEAKDRVGGRIHTVHFGSNFIEMGAQWIHGEKDNIIYEIADSKKLVNKEAHDYGQAIHTFLDIYPIEGKILTELLRFLFTSLENIPEDASHPSILSYLDEQFEIFTSNIDSPKLHKDFWRDVYDWICKHFCEINGCFSLSSLSLKLLGKYKECPGNPLVELAKGYSSVLSLLQRLLPTEWIVLNKAVVKIDWSAFHESSAKNPMVKITCNDGDVQLADHVISTISLGCLKRYERSLYVPSLSSSKRDLIHSLGFGGVNKVYLEFEEPFWKMSEVYHVLGEVSLKEKLMKGTDQTSKCFAHCISRFAYTPGHPKMLCAWISGEGAVIMESLSDQQVIQDCMKLLEIILKKQLTTPTQMIRSCWFSDPYINGGYSYMAVGCENLARDLSMPEYAKIPCLEHPVLLFAGEATHECYFSTVHGAYETGIREAERLFHHYRNMDFRLSDPEELIHRKMDILSSNQKLSSDIKIIIVGAGLAGLACALHLSNNNFTNITVLEAQDKFGGRVHTINSDGGFLELGAHWVHGTDTSLYDFCKKRKLLPPLLDETSQEGKGFFCTPNGDLIPEKTVQRAKNIMKDAKEKLDAGSHSEKPTKSVLEFFTEAFYHSTSNCDKSGVSIMKNLFDWYIKFEEIDNACDNLSSISVQSYTEWDECPENMYHINFKRGFSSLVDAMVSELPKDSIKLNSPVINIRRREDFVYNQPEAFSQNRSPDGYPVVVRCKSGSEYVADCVVVTTSVGFLQHNVKTFFTPPLPHKKLSALRTIGFGTVDKMYLMYKEPFWTSTDLGFQLIWTDCQHKEIDLLLQKFPWIRGITGFDVKQNVPGTLVGWIGGEDAQQMENVEEETVKDVCSQLLRLFLNRPHLPNPTGFSRSCWYNNEYVRGSYSNRTLSYYEHDSTLHDFQCPLFSTYTTQRQEEMKWPSVLFAGEATDEHSFSSAHGAFRSGLRAAECLRTACLQVEEQDA